MDDHPRSRHPAGPGTANPGCAPASGMVILHLVVPDPNTRKRLSRREETLMAEKLRPEEIEAWTAAHPRWRFRDGAIHKEYAFQSFRSAIVFVNRVATIADELKHHPDIDVRYDRVILRMWSHDAGGVTERDLNLAKRIDFATSAR